MCTAKSKYLTPVLSTLAALTIHPAQAGETWFATKLVGEFNNSHTGLEVATPNFKLNDADSDGYPESVTVKFDVYSLGSTTKHYSTASRVLNTPALGTCSDPEAAADTLDVHRTWAGRAATGTRVTLVMELQFECDGNMESRTVAYSAMVDKANGASWRYNSPNNHFLLAADGVDKTSPPDGMNDVLVLMMSHDVTAGSNNRTVEIRFHDGVVVSNRDYPFGR